MPNFKVVCFLSFSLKHYYLPETILSVKSSTELCSYLLLLFSVCTLETRIENRNQLVTSILFSRDKFTLLETSLPGYMFGGILRAVT